MRHIIRPCNGYFALADDSVLETYGMPDEEFMAWLRSSGIFDEMVVEEGASALQTMRHGCDVDLRAEIVRKPRGQVRPEHAIQRVGSGRGVMNVAQEDPRRLPCPYTCPIGMPLRPTRRGPTKCPHWPKN